MPSAVVRQERSATSASAASLAVKDWLGDATVSSSDGRLSYQHRHLADDGVALTRFSSRGPDVRLRVARVPDLVAFVVRDGSVILQRGAESVRLGVDEIGLLPLGEELELRWDRVSIDAFSLAPSAVAALIGVLGRPLRVHARRLTPQSDALATLWRDTANLLATRVLTTPDAYERDLVRTQQISALAATTIEAFDISERTEDDAGRAAVVRARAEAFMASRLREPITIPDIAHAAGVSIRGLQLAYRRDRQVSPLVRLRQLRLDAARAALETGQAESVAAVARDIGYTNAGRFAAHYRSQFGESPSVTLGRGLEGILLAEAEPALEV